MYVYVHIYIYIYIYICVCVYTYTYIYLYIRQVFMHSFLFFVGSSAWAVAVKRGGGLAALRAGASSSNDDVFTPESQLPTPGQRGNSPQQHTATGTAAPPTTGLTRDPSNLAPTASLPVSPLRYPGSVANLATSAPHPFTPHPFTPHPFTPHPFTPRAIAPPSWPEGGTEAGAYAPLSARRADGRDGALANRCVKREICVNIGLYQICV